MKNSGCRILNGSPSLIVGHSTFSMLHYGEAGQLQEPLRYVGGICKGE